MPHFHEPDQPITGTHQFQHTKRWSATIAPGDAFVFVTPEYHHSFNAATKNALGHLDNEWPRNAVGFVSYGGAALRRGPSSNRSPC